MDEAEWREIRRSAGAQEDEEGGQEGGDRGRAGGIVESGAREESDGGSDAVSADGAEGEEAAEALMLVRIRQAGAVHRARTTPQERKAASEAAAAGAREVSLATAFVL